MALQAKVCQYNKCMYLIWIIRLLMIDIKNLNRNINILMIKEYQKYIRII